MVRETAALRVIFAAVLAAFTFWPAPAPAQLSPAQIKREQQRLERLERINQRKTQQEAQAKARAEARAEAARKRETAAAKPEETEAASAATLPDNPQDGIAGIYTGYYICAQGYTPVKLAIASQTGEALSAVFSFQPPGGAVGGARETAFEMRGKYVTSSGQFQLEPNRWLTAAPIGYAMAGLKGSYDPAAGALQAQIEVKGCTMFEVKRDPKLSAQLRTSLASAQERVKNLPPAVLLNGSYPDTCEGFQVWTSRVKKEYPGEDLYRMQAQLATPKIANLFEDEYFARFFGKPYDQLTAEELQRIGTTNLGACLNDAKYRSVMTWELSFVGLLRAKPGSPGHARTMGDVIVRRKMRQELPAFLKQVQSVPGEAAGWDQALAFEKQSKQFEVLWPSEFKGLSAAVQEAKSRTAKPALMARLESQLSSASLDSLDALEKFREQNAAMIAAAGPETENDIRQKITTRKNSLEGSMISEARASLAALPGGLAGLQQGAAWYWSYGSRLGRSSQPAAGELIRAFQSQRSQLLAASQQELTRLIQQAKTPNEVDRLLHT